MMQKIRRICKDFFLAGRWRYSPLFFALERIVARAPEEKTAEIAFRFAAVQRLKGDYLEFGTFGGASFVRAYRFAQAFGLSDMRFYAFDSFCGLPAVSAGSPDDRPDSIFREGDFFCSLADFRRTLIAAGVRMEKVDIVPGWYRETLTPVLRRQLPIELAAVVLIDCDLYDSTVSVLDFITPYMQDGTVLMFDDWFAFKGRLDSGQPRALAEWLKKNTHLSVVEYRRHEWASMAFIVHVDESLR